ncbi:MAG: hypothetical protein IAE83_15650 [Anaerolinea sp.]|nr:hypothetical protein [Anaerolinea sp.]CAG1007552.1 hypothetical protein ANRL4_03766 [Anaerolineae bacterium]
MPYSEQEKEAIRAYVSRNFERTKRKKRVGLWFVNLFIYLMLLGIAIAAAVSGELEAAFVIMVIAGAISLLIHSFSSGTEGKFGDRKIRQALIEEYHRRGSSREDAEAEIFGDREPDELVVKRKNQETYRLSDDGELVPESEFEAAERRQQRRA